EIQKRSYPNSFGGQHALQGYELIESLDLVKNATVIAEEAVALHGAPQRTDIIQAGQFRGYLSNRETAHLIGLQRSSGAMRTEGWNRLPIIRMTNVSLLPGTWDFDDLIQSTDDGILMETNRSWSIDDRRYQFQFSTEIGWEIKGGKKIRML